uniref:Uncharacterized protein n=1 Tax=Solanum lycopersicum TaxID=4081 RepID=A0A3Q7HYN9_SOLLC
MLTEHLRWNAYKGESTDEKLFIYYKDNIYISIENEDRISYFLICAIYAGDSSIIVAQ